MFADQLGAEERKLLFDAIEKSAGQSGVAVTVIDVSAHPPRALYASSALETLLRRPMAELFNAAPLDFLTPDARQKVVGFIASRPPGAPPALIEAEMIRGDGTTFMMEIAIARLTSSLGELGVCHVRDVTARHEMIAALRRSEGRFRTLIAQAPDGVVILQDGVIVFANDQAARLLGVGAAGVIGVRIATLMPPTDAARAFERIRAMMRDFPPSEYGTLADPHRVVEIKSIPYEWEGKPAVLAFARDVSERARLRHELVRADRLAAVGTMAAAVAHEINNPLTYATLSLDLLEQRLSKSGPDAALAEHIRNARDGIGRVATIVRDLSLYARDRARVSGRVIVADAIDRALKLVDHDLRHRARIDRKLAAVPPIDGDASRLEQVLVNLFVNAAQALTRTAAQDVVTIETSVDARGDVVIAVSDTGPGIAPELRERIFEPFFTTKPIGEGTGLGLSVCKSIIEGMGGRIDAATAEGGGTCITVHLPPFRERPATTGAPAERAATGATPPRLKVLVVQMMLAPFHEVSVVASGEAALQAIREHTFDAMVCDVMMPAMDGMELYEAVRAAQAGLERRIVFVSGGAFLPRLAAFLEGVPNPKVAKPFEEKALLAAISAVAAG